MCIRQGQFFIVEFNDGVSAIIGLYHYWGVTVVKCDN